MEDPWREMYTIAVIDDDIFIGDMLEKALSKEGYQSLEPIQVRKPSFCWSAETGSYTAGSDAAGIIRRAGD